jgi:hypothetical protein
MSNLQKFNATLEDFDKEVGKLKAVSEAYQKLQSLTLTYDEITKQFKNNSKVLEDINDKLRAEQVRIQDSLGELLKLIEEKTDKIRKENKEFYQELENTVKIKLSDNKSEIKQLIENERTQIKQIFEIEFAKNSKELRQVIENRIDKQTQILLKDQKGTKIALWILGSITIIISGLILLKILSFVVQ